jgi:hypothetical protein
MAAPNGADALVEARLALTDAEERRDAAEPGSLDYHQAVREAGQRWRTVLRLTLEQEAANLHKG